MKIDPKELKSYPSVMSKEEFRTACHISKRTALYLLQSGLIPSETTGKKTRCYKIKKSDVIAFVKDREQNPDKYIAPENWYKDNGAFRTHAIRFLPPDEATKQEMQQYYEGALKLYSDVMDVADICEYTGYDRRTVSMWVRKGRLKIIMKTGKFLIPKCYLLEYLCSDWYNKTIRKSPAHLSAIWDIYRKSQTGGSLRKPVQSKLTGGAQ